MAEFEREVRSVLKERAAEESSQLELGNGRVLDILNTILSDRTVPKNIKTIIEGSKNMLGSKGSLEVKISSIINDLDSVTNDPNMPLYTRTQIWNLVSLLEEERNKRLKV